MHWYAIKFRERTRSQCFSNVLSFVDSIAFSLNPWCAIREKFPMKKYSWSKLKGIRILLFFNISLVILSLKISRLYLIEIFNEIHKINIFFKQHLNYNYNTEIYDFPLISRQSLYFDIIVCGLFMIPILKNSFEALLKV